MTAAIEITGLGKRFTLHGQGGVVLTALSGIDLTVTPGECVVLDGPSGAGKSTLMRILYGNYRVDRGHVAVRHQDSMVDLGTASPRLILDMRRRTLGYVSQFLRVIPRVSTIDLVAEPLRAVGLRDDDASDRAAVMLERVGLPPRLWSLPPATFSGGEQQRVNIARGLIVGHRVLLVDEPTASLDAENSRRVIELLHEARSAGAAIVAICHDAAAREALATRRFTMPIPELAA
jgi:alpha-D-ribose 1-methylphosphonate 5-triphosphate synthase subunit PhnL